MADYCCMFSCGVDDDQCPVDVDCYDCSFMHDCGACVNSLECPDSPYSDNIVNMGGVYDA